MKISEQQQLLEALVQKKSELDKRIARLEARREADERQWAQHSAELKERFGTDDLIQIRAKLEQEKQENETCLLECQRQIEEAFQQVAAMEQALAELDAASNG